MVSQVRTIDFLPEIFRTKTNEQFLSATLDQLVQQPKTEKIQGYIGSKFGYGVKTTDMYVPENSKVRNDYQLEPAVVFKDSQTSKVTDVLTYQGFIDALQNEGAIVKDHNKIFSNQFYSWDSFVDLDKVVNYGQYYWLPNGPESVTVTNAASYLSVDYTVTTNGNAYDFKADTVPMNTGNPPITLLRGGTYKFIVDQDSPFYIQGYPGVAGAEPTRPNMNVRDILGVTNNGTKSGTITFQVPTSTEQSSFEFPGNFEVDLVTTKKFSEIHGRPLSEIKNIDGVTSLDGRTIIFYGSTQEEKGYIGDLFASTPFGVDNANEPVTDIFEDGFYTNVAFNVYQITYVGTGTDIVLSLSEYSLIPNDIKITALYGSEYIHRNFVKPSYSDLFIIPFLSAPLDTLYYQDGFSDTRFGKIKIIDQIAGDIIDVNVDILGQKTYTSPNGVKFTNGLKVTFAGQVTPQEYKGRTFYVEGVGTSINLLSVNEFIVPEPFTESYSTPFELKSFDIEAYGSATAVPVNKDHITINRNSNDRNAWSRSNRWFHHDVLTTTIENTPNSPITQAALNNNDTRAKRPIIEFYSNLKLFNHGVGSKSPIDFIDFGTTDAFSEVSGKRLYHADGSDVTLFDGARIVFANDANPEVKNKIYIVSNSVIDSSEQTVITLSTAVDGNVLPNEQVICLQGSNSGKSFFFDGNQWTQSQAKTQVNQPPMFDVFDSNDISFGDQTYYTGSDFTGCTLFQYAVGTGVDDTVLGIPLAYSSVNNIGDITFEASLNTASFNFVVDNVSTSMPVNYGYVYKYSDRTTYERQIGWQTAVGESFQYQIFKFDGKDAINNSFTCDITPKDQTSTPWPTMVVYVDNERIAKTDYTLTIEGTSSYVAIPSATASQRIQIMIYSDQVSEVGYYQIPSNLDSNPFNYQVTTLSSGDIRGHFKSICNNSAVLTGSAFGPNNYRDLGNVVPFGTRIIQNSASMGMPALFLRNPDYNIFNSLTYNATEYIKFKSLIINSVTNGDYNSYQTVDVILDDILNNISAIRNESSPFYWSDMLPSKNARTIKNYSFAIKTNFVEYPLTRIYNFSKAGYYSVLVYLTRVIDGTSVTAQLSRDIDYIISETDPKVSITYNLIPGDKLTIKEYDQTFGSFVPNTPTKMGLYPKTIPEIILDDTALTPTYFIVGHDGSYTKLYGEYVDGLLTDARDRVLLEFEQRIYNNLKVKAKIPLVREQIMEGYFRKSPYTTDEIQSMYSTQFLNWVGLNRVEYKPQYFDATNPFTWNYNLTKNKTSNQPIRQGNWRGIYLELYDTARPHVAPWEMIGYTNRPSWWNERYGTGPYTSDNTLLWGDMEKGIDWNNGSPYTEEHYQRPGLSNFLPVDTYGNLVPPINSTVGFADDITFNRDWKVGDVGPAEYSYLKSSVWPFDLMRLFALTKTPSFFTLGFDLDAYRHNDEFDQYLIYDRLRAAPQNLTVYGQARGQDRAAIDNTAQHGYAAWVVDYLQQFGVDGSTTIADYIKSLQVGLVYKIGGFTDKEMTKFYVEKGNPNSTNSSLLIPDESYDIILRTMQPAAAIVYSSVIVQKTENGFAIFGNSQNKAYFTTLTPKFNGNYETITVSNLTVKVTKEYAVKETVYAYGHEFTTPQAISEFLMNYGRYLELSGLVFDAIENNTVLNWKQMVAELLYWIQSGWEVGSTVNINPAAKQLKINRPGSVVQSLTKGYQNYALNQNLIPIQIKDLGVYRNRTEFVITPLTSTDTISYFVANLSSMEHVAVFDNVTVFNDVIFNLTTGLRQQRMFVRGIRTADWDGTFDTAGFILNQDNIDSWLPNQKYTKGEIVHHKNSYWVANGMIKPSIDFSSQDWTKTDYEKISKGMLPNASSRAFESTLYYDATRSNLNSDADLLSFSLVGYRPRDYLTQANIPSISQFNVFKNLIKSKGTSNSINTLQGATLTQGTVEYDIYENWAIKSGEYGGLSTDNFVEMELDKNLLTGNPAIVALTDGESTDGVQQYVQLHTVSNYGKNLKNSNILSTINTTNSEDEVFRSAGYASFDDVRFAAYNFKGLNGVAINDLYKNDYVWLADNKNDWNVLTPVPIMAGKSAVHVVEVSNNLDGTCTVKFTNVHGLVVDDLIGIANFDSDIDGFYTVDSVPSIDRIVISVSIDPSVTSISGFGTPISLSTHRIPTPSDIKYLPLLDNEFKKNTVWVDSGADGNWEVLRKSINFSGYNVPAFGSTETYGNSVAYHPVLGYFIADEGKEKVYRVKYNTELGTVSPQETLVPLFNHTTPHTFGTNIFVVGDMLFISQPDNVGTNSFIWVYKLVSTDKIQRAVYQQYIWITGGGIGEVLTASGDTNYLFASASSYSGVTVFQRNVEKFIDTTAVFVKERALAGATSFNVIGNKVVDLPAGEDITFANDRDAPIYTIVTSKYNSVTNTTQFFIDRPLVTDIESSTELHTSSINYTFVGAFTAGNDSTDGFGQSISTDYTGRMIFVGAPLYDASFEQQDTGMGYVFERLAETFEVQVDAPPYALTAFKLPWPTSNTQGYAPGSAVISINGERLPADYSRIFSFPDISDPTVGETIIIIGPQVYAGDLISVDTSRVVEKQVINIYDDPSYGVVPGAMFSKGMDCNVFGSDLIVGAPRYIDPVTGEEGAAVRFINEGKKYGTITGIRPVQMYLYEPVDIMINGFRVSLPAGNAQAIADAINNADINNVSAGTLPTDGFEEDRDADRLQIYLRDVSIGQANNKLTLTVFFGSVLYYLGISEYTKVDVFINPHSDKGSDFGYTVKFNENSSVAISAPTGNRYVATEFDFTDDEKNHNDTVFDNNFTQFIDSTQRIGAVYLYDYVPEYNESLVNAGAFMYSQILTDDSTDSGVEPRFGTSLYFGHNRIIVGTPNFKPDTVGGRVTLFNNSTGETNWKLFRKSNDIVDINKVQKVQLYDNINGNLIEALDYIDPIQGKLLGAVRENIDFVSYVDPAGYNNPAVYNGNIVWGKEHVGSIWFDPSSTRFINYHQGDSVYNSKNWGKVFPGSSVTVYTWIESDVTPAFYVGVGTPLDMESYATAVAVDSASTLVSKYYYWVRNTNRVFAEMGKTLSDSVIERYIADPQQSGISFFSPYSSSVYGLHNVSDKITFNTSLYIGFSNTDVDNPTHTKFELIRDGHPDDFLPGFPLASNRYDDPTGLYLKLLDSFAGLDSNAALVPNPYLPKLMRIGISTNPNQSLFVDRLDALKAYLTFVNEILIQYPIYEFKEAAFLNMSGANFDTTMYWGYVNWWADGYSDSTRPITEVAIHQDLYTLTPFDGMIAGVQANSNGRYETYVYANNDWVRVGLEKGTIQFNSSLWDYSTSGIGLSSSFFDTDNFDTYPATETRYIIRAINEQLFVGELFKHRNEGLILIFEFIQSESIGSSQYLPWLNKTSFIDIGNKVRDLVATPKYQKDDTDLLYGFINEVKPYHTVIKDFFLKYSGLETYASGVTDFDLPALYNANLSRFASPQLTYSVEGANQYLSTNDIWNHQEYTNWIQHVGMTLAGSNNTVVALVAKYVNEADTEIYVDNAYGLPVQGVIRIDDELMTYSQLNRVTGRLYNLSRGFNGTDIAVHYPNVSIYMDLPGVIVIDSGRNYIDPPKITARIDTTKYIAPVREAVMTAIMSGDKVIGVTVNDPGEGYVTVPEIYIEPSISAKFNEAAMNFEDNTIIVPTDTFVTGDLVRFVDLEADTTSHEMHEITGLIPEAFYYVRVITTFEGRSASVPVTAFGDAYTGNRTLISLHTSYVNARSGDHPVELYFRGDLREEMLEDPTVMEYALEIAAKASPIIKNAFSREIKTVLKYDRTSYGSDVQQWEPGMFWPAPFNSYGNDASSDTKLATGDALVAQTSWQGAVVDITQVDGSDGTAVVTVDYSHSNGLQPGQIKGLKMYFYKTFSAYQYDATGLTFDKSQINGFTMWVEVFAGNHYPSVGDSVYGVGVLPNTEIVSDDGTIVNGFVTYKVYTVNLSQDVNETKMNTLGGAKFKIYRPRFDPSAITNSYYIIMEESGFKYQDGDRIKVFGTELGGRDGTNDFYLDIVYTTIYGGISIYEITGVAKGEFSLFYANPISQDQIKIYSDSAFKIPVLIDRFNFQSGDSIFVPEPFNTSAGYKYVVTATVVYENNIYHCIQSNSDLVFDPNKWQKVSSDDRSLNAIDRVLGFYKPTSTMPANLLQVVQGTTYPYNIYKGNVFSPNDELPLDIVLQDQPFYPRDIIIKSIAFDGTHYVAAADTAKNSIVMISTDSLNWDTFKISNKILNVTGLITTNSPSYYITSTTTTSPVLLSFDLENWETLGEFTPYDVVIYGESGFDSTALKAPNKPLNDVIAVNERYYAVGEDIVYSDNGLAWTSVFGYGSSLPNQLYSIINVETLYYAGFVAVGFGTTVPFGAGTALPTLREEGRVVISVDGVEWTTVNPALTTETLRAVAASETTIVVAGTNSKVYYVTNKTIVSIIDPTLWTEAEVYGDPITATINDAYYADGVFVLVGNNGTVLNSTNGTEWAQVNSGTTYNLLSITFDGEYFIAAGEHGTIIRSNDQGATWTDVSFITTKAPSYDIKGGDFVSGYGPEELVAGIVNDSVSMKITTKPGAFWDNDEITQDFKYGYTGFDMQSVRGPLTSANTISFAGLIDNPVQISVFTINKVTGLAVRLYEDIQISAANPYTYTIDWINKVVTLSQALETTLEILIEVYEFGNGRAIVKTNTQHVPLQRIDGDTGNSVIKLDYKYTANFSLFSAGSVNIDPVVYLNGKKLVNLDDFNVYFTNNVTHIEFNEVYDASVDYITFVLLSNTVVPEFNELLYSYSIPETEVFAYDDSNEFTLSNFIGEDNINNAIVEVNGYRLGSADYVIDSETAVLTINSSLTWDDIVAVTTFYDTKRQNLKTIETTGLTVFPIHFVDNSTTPVMIITEVDHGLVDTDQIQIDGLKGSVQLNTDVYYVKVIDDRTVELYEDFEIFGGNPIFAIPVEGGAVSAYKAGSGYIWKYADTVEVVNAGITYTAGNRTWVTINGTRVDPEQLRFGSGNKLSIMAPVVSTDSIIITSMVSNATPTETMFNLTVSKNGISSVYRMKKEVWLTKPLYTYENVIHVSDSRKLVSNIFEDVTVTQVGERLVGGLAYRIEDMSGAVVYNKSTLTTLSKSQYVIKNVDGRPSVIFSSGVTLGDELSVEIQIGHMIELNGERIHFDSIDHATNTVSGLIRGMNMTGVVKVHNIYSYVYGINDAVMLNPDFYGVSWSSTNFLDAGDPFQLSTSPAAKFLNTGKY